MLGIEDPQIIAAYAAMIVCTAACIIYGVSNWNTGGDEDGS